MGGGKGRGSGGGGTEWGGYGNVNNRGPEEGNPTPEAWEPLTSKVKTHQSKAPSREGPGKATMQNLKGQPLKSQAGVPYYEVLEPYKQEAAQAIDREDVPRAYQRQVREYFESLDKGAPKRK